MDRYQPYLLVFITLLGFPTQAADSSVVRKILGARSKQEAYQEYKEVFNKHYKKSVDSSCHDEQRKYLAWYGRLYRKACLNIEEKNNDRAISVMAQGMRRMFRATSATSQKPV